MIGVIDQEKRVIYIGTSNCEIPQHVIDTASSAGYSIEVSDDVVTDTSDSGINLESLKQCIHELALRDEILKKPRAKDNWNNFTKGGNGKKGKRRKFMRRHK